MTSESTGNIYTVVRSFFVCVDNVAMGLLYEAPGDPLGAPYKVGPRSN